MKTVFFRAYVCEECKNYLLNSEPLIKIESRSGFGLDCYGEQCQESAVWGLVVGFLGDGNSQAPLVPAKLTADNVVPFTRRAECPNCHGIMLSTVAGVCSMCSGIHND